MFIKLALLVFALVAVTSSTYIAPSVRYASIPGYRYTASGYSVPAFQYGYGHVGLAAPLAYGRSFSHGYGIGHGYGLGYYGHGRAFY